MGLNNETIFICAIFFTVSAGMALIVCGVVVARPGLWAKNFQVVSLNYLELRKIFFMKTADYINFKILKQNQETHTIKVVL